jgi:hypothetical protein
MKSTKVFVNHHTWRCRTSIPQDIDSQPEAAAPSSICLHIDDSFVHEPRVRHPHSSTENARTGRKLWTGARSQPRRPPRDELERACRIALMEGEGPVSVEVIYERVLRRGSLTFYAYKRPFRAITVVMTGLTRRGEVALELRLIDGNASGRRQKRLWMRVVPETA